MNKFEHTRNPDVARRKGLELKGSQVNKFQQVHVDRPTDRYKINFENITFLQTTHWGGKYLLNYSWGLKFLLDIHKASRKFIF